MNAAGISIDDVRLSNIALRMAERGQFVCAICGHVTDDAAEPCPKCGAPWAPENTTEQDRMVLH